MSCNGCRVLRKGCSDACTLRPCLQWIESPEAQGHATVFVAKFFGRAGLMSFISAVPESQRAALFQSLLYEACGRTVNPVHGAVGLLWTGNWHICQAAVETVLKGGTVRPATSVPSGSSPLQYSAAMSLASIHRSTMASVPEAAAVLTLSSSEPSFPAARTFNEASRPNKRPLDESATAVDRNIACSSQERLDSKRYRTGEQDCDGAKLVRGVQQQPQPKNDPPSYPSLAAIWTPKPQFSTETSGAAEFSDLRKREQPRTGAGQLVAPVPIRVCPRLDDTEFHGLFRAGGGETPQRKSNVELDLTLNSIRSSSSRAKPGLVRVSSPSTISVNSEGSVTSLESADLSISPWPIRLTPSPELQEHKLLDLLL